MALSASRQDVYKMALEWEDEDEVVVKVEPADEDEVERAALSPGDVEDLVNTEDWTHFGDISRKCYVNKRRSSLPDHSVVDRKHAVEEFSFCIKDDEFLLSEDVVVENEQDKSDEDEPYSLIDLDAQENDRSTTNVDCSKRLLGYFRESENDDGDSSSSSDDDNRYDTNFSEEAYAPAEGNADDDAGVHELPDNDSAQTRPIGNSVDFLGDAEAGPKGATDVKKIIYLKRVPKEFVLKHKVTVKPLPGTVIVQTSATDIRPGTSGANGSATVKTPIYSRGTETNLVDRTNQKRSYLRESAASTVVRTPTSKAPPPASPHASRSGYVNFTVRTFVKTTGKKTNNRGSKTKAGEEEEAAHECTLCKRVFRRRKHLLVHARIHTGERKAPTKPCPDCGKLFPDNTQLRIHSRVHTGETPFSCALCDKQFKHQTSLARHVLFHTRERPFPCGLCEKTYRTRSDLVNHTRTHTDERPYACAHCGKRFHDRCAKNTHERIHAEKKYKCTLCSSSFAQSTTLKGHMVTHTDERPFECCFCGMRFKSKVVLRSHLRVHTAEKTFKCADCSQLFTEKRTLMRHVYTHTAKPFPCAYCKRWYFRRERWAAHVKTHGDVKRPFACDVCPKRYASRGYLKLHRIKTHDKAAVVTAAGTETAATEDADKVAVKDADKVAVKDADKVAEKDADGSVGPGTGVGTKPQRDGGSGKRGRVEPFKCNECKGTFKSKRSLLMHVTMTHAVKGVRRKVKTDKHSKTAGKETAAGASLHCTQCGQLFRHKSTLARHHKYTCK